MTAERTLIVNADDFGQSPGINQGIATAHERGIVTSASLMVRWPAAAEAAGYGRRHPQLSVGLHFDLGEWTYQGGEWVRIYEVVQADDQAAVREEALRQLETFRRLMGQDPTHIDSHQHVHREEPAHTVLRGMASSLDVPLRLFSPLVSYCGGFYGQTDKGAPHPEGISVDGLRRILSGLSPGVTELGCHPGDGSELNSMYSLERAEEVKTLCDTRIRETLDAEAIRLCSFREIDCSTQGEQRQVPTNSLPGNVIS